MFTKKDTKILLILAAVFGVFYYLPVDTERFQQAVIESLALAKWYAREHVLLCLLPAFFIAGAISVFVSQASVMKYLGAGANKILAYGVASVSGTILAVCSCTVLPLFAGIYRMGAGLGPATAFLYSGPAINVLAIILTARILGVEIGIARAIGAVVFSLVIGILMHWIFRKEEQAKQVAAVQMPEETGGRPLWKTAIYFAAMVGILVFANWGKPKDAGPQDFFLQVWQIKWFITAGFAALLTVVLIAWFALPIWKFAVVAVPAAGLSLLFPYMPELGFSAGVIGLATILATTKGPSQEWFGSTWTFTKQILPLLLGGVLVAGFLLGRPDPDGQMPMEGLIPAEWVQWAVGGNSWTANFFASIAGAFMYFATLTEVPILEGLMRSGMGKGPALALLLAGPALSLPNMLVIRSVMGTKKTVVYVALVVVMATISGIVFGMIVG